MSQVIKSEILQKIKEDEALIFEIAQATGKKFRSVYRWACKNTDELVAPVVLQMIKDRFKIVNDSEILESAESKVA
jgi:hypothetical protein